MLNLHRLRILTELSRRGTVAAVAEALQFTPSAISQQLSILEREAGVELLQRVGRGLRLTDAGRLLVAEADDLLAAAAVAEAKLAAISGTVTGRRRIAGFRSAALHLALPAIEALARDEPALRCEFVEAEPEQALPELALGDVDLVLADEWQHEPRAISPQLRRHELLADPIRLVLRAGHPLLASYPDEVPLSALADAAWAAGHEQMGWQEITQRVCREFGGFEPDIRHRVNDATVGLELASRGLAVILLPQFALLTCPPGVELRGIAGGSIDRAVFAVERVADAERPSSRALLAAIRAAVDQMASTVPTNAFEVP